MKKICIDAKPHVTPGDLTRLLGALFGMRDISGVIDLTEGEVYTGHYCSCGEHFVVDKDDSGDTNVTYIKERFTDVPDISEVIEYLQQSEVYV